MSLKWRNATQRYQQIQEQKRQAEPPKPQEARADDDERQRVQNFRIDVAASDLARFLDSSGGEAAMALLKAAKRHIIFGEESETGTAVVDFIDGNGLQRSVEPSGTWTVYAKKEDLPVPKISSITPRDAIHAAVWRARRKPHEVLPWLYAELDKLADAAPQP